MEVTLSAAEREAVGVAAAKAGMAAASWLGEVGVRAAREASSTAVAGEASVARELFALRAELMQQRRVLRNVGGNLNDVAAQANAGGGLRADTARVQELVARVVAEVDAQVRRVDAQVSAVLARRSGGAGPTVRGRRPRPAPSEGGSVPGGDGSAGVGE
jgi:hypothetical protein